MHRDTIYSRIFLTASTLLLLAVAVLALMLTRAHAQAQPKLTNPTPIKITTGLTYQQVLPLNGGRQSLTIQNNNSADQCEIIVGGPWQVGDTTTTSRTISGTSMTALQASIILTAGQSYTRYFPYVPSDVILGTCTTTGDSLYVDTQ